MDGLDRRLLVRRTRLRRQTLLDAVRVGDDQRRTVVVLGLVKGLDRRGRVGTHRDVRDVDVLVLHLHQAEVLLGLDLARRRELRDRAGRRRLGSLAARVGVDLGVHDEDLDVLAGGENVVKTAVADIVGPAVTAEHPDRLADEVVGNREELRTGRATRRLAGRAVALELGDERAHLFDAGALRVELVDLLDLLEARLHLGRGLLVGESLGDELERILLELVGRHAHAHTELGVVLEERV